MKPRNIIIMLLMAVPLTVMSQMRQKGIARTVGKETVGGSYVKGQRLQNVIIEPDCGNEAKSNSEGEFTLMVSRKNYFLKEIYKQGYKLIDPEVLTRQYYYSENAHEIVMVNIAQSAEKRLADMKASRQAMQRELRQKQSEIDRLLSEHKISSEEYERRCAELSLAVEKIQSRADELAEKLSKLDPEVATEFDNRVRWFIEQGQIKSADSLLQTVGDLHNAVSEHCKKTALLTSEMMKHPDQVEKYKRMLYSHKGQGGTLAMLCLDHYFIARMCFDDIRAEDYIELRASVDTNEISWQMDAAAYHLQEKNMKRATEIYDRLIRRLKPLAVAEPSVYDFTLSTVLNNRAMIYNDCGQMQEAEQLYREALSIRQRLAMNNEKVFAPYVAQTQNNLGVLYLTTNKVKQAEKLFSGALGVRRRLAETDPAVYAADKAATQGNLALVYACMKQYDRDIMLCEEAVKTYNELIQMGFEQYAADRASILNNLAATHRMQGNLQECERSWWDALTTYSILTQSSPKRYRPYLQSTLDNLFEIYDVDDIACREKRLAVYRQLAGNLPEYYAPEAAQMMNTLADMYDKEGLSEKSDALYKESLAIYEQLAEKEQEKYKAYVARALGNISYHLLLGKQFPEAEDYARRGLASDPQKRFIYANLAASLLLQGRFDEAMQIYDEHKDALRQSFLDDLQTFRQRGTIPAEAMEQVGQVEEMLRK